MNELLGQGEVRKVGLLYYVYFDQYLSKEVFESHIEALRWLVAKFRENNPEGVCEIKVKKIEIGFRWKAYRIKNPDWTNANNQAYRNPVDPNDKRYN